MTDQPFRLQSRPHLALALAAVCLISTALAACAAEPSGSKTPSPPAASSPASSPTEVLARVNGVAVTRAEVEELVAAQLLQLERQRSELIENGVTAKVQDILFEAAAQKKSMKKDDFIKAEVEAKATAIPQEEVDAFYNARAQQIRQPKEQIEPQIRQHLAYQALVKGIESAASIEILTQPFRVEVAGTGPSKGPENAPVTIVEFGDFECPPCGAAYKTVKQVRETYGDKVRVVFRQFPLRSIHPNAQKAGEASLCAGDQGKFWEMHDYLFEHQKQLSVPDLKTAAATLSGLDKAAFESCLDGGKYAKQLDEDLEAGTRAGVGGTPAFFVNGRPLQGVPSIEAFNATIDDELRRAKTQG